MNIDLYSAIFQRKSVRKFDLTPLDEETLQDLYQYIEHLQPLFPEISYTVGTPATHRRNMIPMKAPHYLSFYSEKKEGYLLNIGYLIEQIVLYLTAKGIGSCWLGLAKPVEDQIENLDNQEFVIMLAFGKGASSIYRTALSQFKRKKIEEISDIPAQYELLEAVRLAPSGINRQPWYFSGSAKEIHVYREHLGKIKSSIYNKTDQIDLGIALCHLVISGSYFKQKCIFDWAKNVSKEGYQYVCTVTLEQ